jgi:hypothetical protein
VPLLYVWQDLVAVGEIREPVAVGEELDEE